MSLILQEVSAEPEIEIPEEVREVYKIWRPTPLVRADRLERALKTPARIYFKDESHSPPGSHKPNTAVPQAYYNKKEGVTHLTTETGAGQWGSALAFACKLIGLECKVFMVRISFDQKPFRKFMMQVWGANCVASPSSETNAGRAVLAKIPDTPGSLGIAISEAIEQAVTDKTGKTRYSLGSVLNHVLLHQTIIGLEAKAQLKKAGEKQPDVVIGCAGGGSNFAGLAFPFTYDKINGANIKIVPVEPAACPTMTRGPFGLHDTASGDVHTRSRVYPAAYTCGRPTLSRDGAAGLSGYRRGSVRTEGVSSVKMLRVGYDVGGHRRNDLCTGDKSRYRCRD
jgi:tryptophan synthase beta chain